MSCLDISTDIKTEILDMAFYDDLCTDFDRHQQPFGFKSIIKKRSVLLSSLDLQPKQGKKKKSVVFQDPICEVRLYDKVAAKRQQWGHATKFARVKRFCWDNLNDELVVPVEHKELRCENRWLPNEKDQDYRLMMWRDMQKRRLNRKRRMTGDSLAYLVQGLEISANCIEVVASKMRRFEERL